MIELVNILLSRIFSDWIMEQSATVDSDIVTEHPGPFGSKMKQAQQQKFDLTLSEGESWWSTPETDLISKVSSRIKVRETFFCSRGHCFTEFLM